MHKIPYKTLVDTVYICDGCKWNGKSNGFIKFNDAYKYYRHYWMTKQSIKESINGFSYEEEEKQLDNIVKNRILIKWTILKKKFKNI